MIIVNRISTLYTSSILSQNLLWPASRTNAGAELVARPRRRLDILVCFQKNRIVLLGFVRVGFVRTEINISKQFWNELSKAIILPDLTGLLSRLLSLSPSRRRRPPAPPRLPRAAGGTSLGHRPPTPTTYAAAVGSWILSEPFWLRPQHAIRKWMNLILMYESK